MKRYSRPQLDCDEPLAAKSAHCFEDWPKKLMSVAAIPAVDEDDVAAAVLIAGSATKLAALAFQLAIW